MKGAHPEAKFIYDKLLNNEQRVYIEAFLDEIEEKREKYEFTLILGINFFVLLEVIFYL